MSIEFCNPVVSTNYVWDVTKLRNIKYEGLKDFSEKEPETVVTKQACRVSGKGSTRVKILTPSNQKLESIEEKDSNKPTSRGNRISNAVKVRIK